MKTRNIKALAATALLLGLGAAAQADHVIVCESLDGLSEATDLLSYTKDKDRLGLQGKLTNAGLKIDEGKECDAAQKLKDYRSQVEKLLLAEKVTEVHEGTVTCIDLGSQALIDGWDDGTCPDPGDPPRGKGPKNR